MDARADLRQRMFELSMASSARSLGKKGKYTLMVGLCGFLERCPSGNARSSLFFLHYPKIAGVPGARSFFNR